VRAERDIRWFHHSGPARGHVELVINDTQCPAKNLSDSYGCNPRFAHCLF
jgi:hypothetical protein